MAKPKFQKRHYEAVASVLNSTLSIPDINISHGAGQLLVAKFCEAFLRDNPDFDPSRFREACGITSQSR